MLDCSHFGMLVDPCNTCHLGPTIISCLFLCRKNNGAVLRRSPHGILPKRNPCTSRCFRAKRCPGAEKWSKKKPWKTPGISRSGWKAQKGEGVTPFGFDIRKIVSKTWGRKGEEKTDFFTCYFFQHSVGATFFFVHRSFTRWFLEVQVTFFNTKLFVGFHFCTRVFGA